MCTNGDGVPSSAGEAFAMMVSALDFLNGPGREELSEPALGEALRLMAVIRAKQAAVWNALLSRFDSYGGHDADGFGSTVAWLAGQTQTPPSAAHGQVRHMRQATGRPLLDGAMAEGALSESWTAQIIKWSAPLPAEFHEDLDRLLLASIGEGALLKDLGLLIAKFIEEWKKTRPDPDDPVDDDGFDDRKVTLSHTFGGAGRMNGDLTRECAAAWQAVFDSLGKKRGREDTRTAGQRMHDAMQEAAELLLRAKLVPDRAGADTRVDAVISLAALRGLDGAGPLEDAWLAAGAEAGHHIYVSGPAAEALSCDALITPVVTAGADWTAITQMIDLITNALNGHAPAAHANAVQDNADWDGADHRDVARDLAGRDDTAQIDTDRDDAGRGDVIRNDARQADAAQDNADQDNADWDHATRNDAGRDRADRDDAGRGAVGCNHVGRNDAAQDNAGRNHTSRNDAGRGDAGHNHIARDNSAQDNADRDHTGRDHADRNDAMLAAGLPDKPNTAPPPEAVSLTPDTAPPPQAAPQTMPPTPHAAPPPEAVSIPEAMSTPPYTVPLTPQTAPPQPAAPPRPQTAPLTSQTMPLTPQAWQAVLQAVAKLAVGFVSGPGGLASTLRTNLMPAPWNSRSVPIDVGWSQHVPEPIRRAVMLRDRKCRWPGCDKRPSVCDVHHIRHKKDGGPTSIRDCLLLCQFHHDVCVHRWGWKIELLPGGEVNAYGPYGQVLRDGQVLIDSRVLKDGQAFKSRQVPKDRHALKGRISPGTGPPGLARPA